MFWNGKFGYKVKLNYSVVTSIANSYPSSIKVIVQERVMAEADKSEVIMRVSVRLPPFWRERPEIWFKSVEAQFALPPAITCDLTMYNTVVAALDGDILGQVSDVIMDPPAEEKYKTLKNRLVERFSDSEAKRLKKLLADFSLDGRTPSQLAREMKLLAGNKVSGEFLKTIWLNSMPQNVKAILSTMDGDLEKLAQTADKVFEITEPNAIAAVSHEIPALDQKIAGLEKQLLDLTNAMKQMAGRNEKFVSRRRSRSRSHTNGPEKQQENKNEKVKPENWLCWYHFRFGENARECIKPCAWETKN